MVVRTFQSELESYFVTNCTRNYLNELGFGRTLQKIIVLNRHADFLVMIIYIYLLLLMLQI